ncbi:MAG: hypothetical protein ABSA76_01305 [Bacteroidales bacterium]
MNDDMACTKQLSPIQSALESIIKSQQGIFEAISTGELLMDNVCQREQEDSSESGKELQASNLTEVLQKIGKDNERILAKISHLIKRMRSNF